MKDVSALSWAELEAVQHEDGNVLFPAELRKRNTKGEVVVTKVRMRVSTPLDHLHARRDARLWLKSLNIDPKEDPDYLAQAETMCVLAACIRDWKDPYPQFCVVEELAKYDQGCILDLKERQNAFKDMLDPREPIQDEEHFWRLVHEVTEKRNIFPLADIVGPELPNFIIRLAQIASVSQTKSSSPQSSGTSTPVS